jgi:hypothetical protein
VTIGPSNVVTNQIPFKGFPKDCIPMISDGKAAIYIFGEIHYRDAFQRDHWTRFRLYHGGDQAVGEGGLRGTVEGNETDDE